MKKKLLLMVTILVASVSAMAQKNYTFNAVAFNVDGLPNSILGIDVNSDGKEAAGATELCGILANSGWDFAGISEDFNFHSELTAAPASTYYNFGEHGGSVSGLTNSTDGLGFACLKKYTIGGGTRVAWEEHYGETSDGNDGMINKGFRVYNVTFATGVVVDVYVLHMDASDGANDIAARESQLAQLATYIKANHNNRPVIILGDTNCRYTREQLKTGFIDVINADARFTIKDVWVEHMWGGNYPTYGADAMMTHTYGAQKGEIVDKIFYINTTESNLTLKANSYLHDESVTVSDHMPVVANFTLTDPNGSAPTDAEKEASWTLEETEASFAKPTWQGEEVVSGTTYYVMNVGTGKYIKWGGKWNTQAVTGYAGHPITPTLSDGKCELVTRASEDRSLSTDLYLDNTDDHTWTLTPADDTYNHYYIEAESGALGISDDETEVLAIEAKNASDDTQKWIFLTEAGMIAAMADANPDYPFNFTPMLGAADFDVVDDWGGYAKDSWTNFEARCSANYVQWGAGQDKYNSSAMINSTADAVTISQELSGLPNGNYKISFEAFYNYIFNTTTITETRTRSNIFSSSWSDYSETGRSTSSSEQTMTAQVTVGSETFTLSPNRNVGVGDAAGASAAFRDADNYMTTTYQALSSGTLAVSISKSATSTNPSDEVSESGTTGKKTQTRTTVQYAYVNSVHFDNFRLEYRGTQTVAIDPYADYKKIVRDKVNSTYTKVAVLNDAGQAAYDISFVVSRYDNDQVTTAADAEALCDVVDAAYENAYAAHLATEVAEVVANMDANGGDVTGAIINPSFELGDLTGWTIDDRNGDLAVHETSYDTYSISGSHGDYLFNAWDGDANYTTYIKQTIKGLPNGLYELKAVLASFGTADGKEHDYHVYLTGNDFHTSVAAVGGKAVGHETTLYFLVEDGSATIGAIGGNKGGGTEFIHYWPWEGSFFKADNFRLKRICDVPNGRLKLALNDVAAAGLDGYGQEALNISAYETMYANKSVTGDGTTEAAAVHAALQAAAKAQNTVGADMTWAITNPSFETGDYTGWTTTVGGDTGVKPQENGVYTIAGTNGRYLFNTWNNASDAENSGVNAAITQTVSGLPNGTYKLTAMVATDAANSMNLTANGTTTTIAASTNGATSGVFPEVQCEVTDGTLAIEVVGVNSVWYKCDDFRLTLVAPADLVLNETDSKIVAIENVTYPRVTLNRTIKPNTWSTFVSPFDIPASNLTGWEVKELSSATENAGHVSLSFTNSADGIKKGVPYMVRNASLGENLTAITMENVEVNTVALTEVEGGAVTFIGQYVNKNVPEGDFFISGNTFYQAEDNTNTMKGFRARLVPTSAGVKSVGYSFDDVDFTGIEGVEDNAAEIVAIYGVDGTLRSGLQKGINIVKMSNGATKKVLVK